MPANLAYPEVPELTEAFLESSDIRLKSGCKIGIGIFMRDSKFIDRNNERKKIADWTLVIHSDRYSASDRIVYGIVKEYDLNAGHEKIREGDNWAWSLRNPFHGENLIGVIHVADILWSPLVLQARIERDETLYVAEKNNNNPGGVFAWTASGWVIRVLDKLTMRANSSSDFRLPPYCEIRYLHEKVRERIDVLVANHEERKRFVVINLAAEPEHAPLSPHRRRISTASARRAVNK